MHTNSLLSSVLLHAARRGKARRGAARLLQQSLGKEAWFVGRDDTDRLVCGRPERVSCNTSLPLCPYFLLALAGSSPVGAALEGGGGNGDGSYAT